MPAEWYFSFSVDAGPSVEQNGQLVFNKRFLSLEMDTSLLGTWGVDNKNLLQNSLEQGNGGAGQDSGIRRYVPRGTKLSDVLAKPYSYFKEHPDKNNCMEVIVLNRQVEFQNVSNGIGDYTASVTQNFIGDAISAAAGPYAPAVPFIQATYSLEEITTNSRTKEFSIVVAFAADGQQFAGVYNLPVPKIYGAHIDGNQYVVTYHGQAMTISTSINGYKPIGTQHAGYNDGTYEVYSD